MKYDLVVSIVTYNSDIEYVKNLSESLESFKKIKIKTIIADNMSDSSYFEQLLQLKSNVVSTGRNLGYGKGNNLVNKIASSSKYFLVLNPDIKINEECIYNIFTFMESNTNYALVGPFLKSADSKYYNIFRDNFSFINLFKRWLFKINDKVNEKDFKILTKKYSNMITVNYLSGSFMFFRREVFNQIEGFNRKFFMYFEDVEICDLIKKNKYEIGILKNSEVLHLRNRASYRNISLFFHHFWSWVLYKKNNRINLKL
jgi:GT2 family glycosyltransferase